MRYLLFLKYWFFVFYIYILYYDDAGRGDEPGAAGAGHGSAADGHPARKQRQASQVGIFFFTPEFPFLKVLINEKRGGLKVVAFDRSPFKLVSLRLSNKSVQA
jgi:hypothetical protein